MKKRAIKKITDTKNFFALNTFTDKTAIVKNISDDIYVRENSFWLLLCSVIIASIGLDMNSPVIIAASLFLLPASGPILGLGLSFATFNRELLFDSIKNLAILIFITVAFSYLYFMISPSGLLTEEILVNSEPNLFYIGISFLAGIAALIVNSRNYIVNLLPSAAFGVVIVLPLCSAGFGLAVSDMNIFKGAIDDFFINFMIILLSVFLMVRFINIPVKKYSSKEHTTRSRIAVAVILVLLTIPAVLISYNIVISSGERDMAKKFINEHMTKNDLNVVGWNINKQREEKVLTIYVDENINEYTHDTLNKILTNYISGARLSIVPIQAAGFSGRYENLDLNNRLNTVLQETGQLQKRLDSISRRPVLSGSPGSFDIMMNDLRLMFKNLDTVRLAYKGPDSIPSIAITWKSRKTENLLNENKIVEYVKQKMGFDKLVLMKGIYIDSIPNRKR